MAFRPIIHMQFVHTLILLSEMAEHAAEANGFAAAWGGHQLHNWTHQWINDQKLPESMQGCQAKVTTLLSIPSIATELCAYLHSNKWLMNPEKLVKLTNNKMITKEADLYLKNVINDEMPNALKRYIELELFPCIHLKVGCGILLSTAHCWLHCEGFRYMSHKKGLYFDGHDHPNVVEYHQNVFLPAMKEFEHHLIQYTIGDVEKELFVQPHNYVEHCLVPTPHDKIMAQSNDMNDKEWVFDNEFKLQKKGAGESMEYGKNYEGYWNGKWFCTQMAKKIIPAFKAAHGAGYQALFIIDNSQGHSAYAEDALQVGSHMNVNPGSKQAQMQNG
ncbi:hypothetical protein DFH29DRAFT_874539 [Suillus ampliporus]|nr:hypothetical protein DFH29DRAFT_874539 [Suillus ampliporus]